MAKAIEQTKDERGAQITATLEALKADKVVVEVAKAINATVKQQDGGYVGTIMGLLRRGLPGATIVSGYVLARAEEFAGRPAYRTKNASHVLGDVRKHAANHLVLARAKTLVLQDQAAAKAVA